MTLADVCRPIQQWAMLTDQYVEALLIDPELADAIWESWNAGHISDEVAEWAWWLIALSGISLLEKRH